MLFFPVNKSLYIENSHERTLVNQRHMYYPILKAGVWISTPNVFLLPGVAIKDTDKILKITVK